ncbi:MAG: hypothetical protein K8R87_11145 [Verrucomicrobia bacterium]|nr:hypothetical protein [Verrucomicrobiota bacterium]
MLLILRRWLWIAWNPMRVLWLLVISTSVIVPWLTRNHEVKAQRGEWYPFSNFPMYSTFEPTAYYVYITDENDQPVAMWQTFGTWPSAVKKGYDALLKSEVVRLKEAAKKQGGKYSRKIVEMSGDECRPAGDAILRQLRDASPNQDEVRKNKGYRLHQVDITLDDGRIVQKTKRVGEI